MVKIIHFSFGVGLPFLFSKEKVPEATTPFYFTRAGHTHIGTGSLRDIGVYGRYWSSTASTMEHSAYHLDFTTDTYPSNHNVRWAAFSVQATPAKSVG